MTRPVGPSSNGLNHTTDIRRETDSLGIVEVPADKLWGAQTQPSLEHFNIGPDLILREIITAYATRPASLLGLSTSTCTAVHSSRMT